MTKYITDLQGYEGPIDKVSPYHFYMYNYWRLRQEWRKELYAWTRRPPCDATVVISPNFCLAGNRETLALTVTVGKIPMTEGARIAVYFPMALGGHGQRNVLTCFQGADGQIGYGSRICSEIERSNIKLATFVHSTGSVFTCVETIVESGQIREGETFRIIIGDPVCKLPVIGDGAKSYPFRVAIDYHGNNEFHPVKPDPTLKIGGNQAKKLRCFAPATPKPGELFSIKVVAVDEINGNASCRYEGSLILSSVPDNLCGVKEYQVGRDKHGSILLPDMSLKNSDLTRIQVIDRENGFMGQSNPICPQAAPNGLSLFFGEIHSHTELSDGGGLPEDSLRWARDVEGLDFTALSDHFEDGQSYNYRLEDKWGITKKVIKEFNQPGRFVTLLGYEIGTVEKHRNVYFSDDTGRMIVHGPDGQPVTMENIYKKLEGTDYILIPHAPMFHGINWHARHVRERQRLVEIYSYWGISETGGYKSVRNALDLGLKLGFTGGTDNHVAEPGSAKWGGITGLYATSLTRKDIFNAMMARRTFATTGSRMIITFEINGAFMGEELTLPADTARNIKARVIANEQIEEIQIIRNGEAAKSICGDSRKDIRIDWQDTEPLDKLAVERELTDERFAYYYLRIETVNGDLGWASPVWVHDLTPRIDS